MTNNLLYDLIDYLGLELPVYVELRTISKKPFHAYYIPKYNKHEKVCAHIIKINLENITRGPDTLLAHELIHAWQEENNKRDTHGKSFKKMAAKIEKAFGIIGLYIPDTDQD